MKWFVFFISHFWLMSLLRLVASMLLSVKDDMDIPFDGQTIFVIF
jgi:hypothetical protein